MGLATFSIYKYVRTSKGWRYCKLVQGKNNRLKPDAVLVDGHAEGAYYLNVDGQWEKVGTSAAAAQDEQRKRLARQRYERETGERLPEPEPQGELLPGGHRRLPRGARNKGGHRGAFDAKQAELQMVGMIALLPHAIGVPVIAAGGIADAWGVAAALMLGASAVKIGTGFLRSPEAKIHRAYASRLAKTEAMRPSSRVPSVDGRAAAYYPGLFMNRRQIPVSRSEAPV